VLLIIHVSAQAFAGLLAYLNVSKNGGTVFEWFVHITSITGLITWDIILITYVRFYQGLAYHQIDRDTLPYKAPFQPYASYFGIFFISLIILFNGFQVFLLKSWNVDNFITAYICLPIFLVFYLFWKIVYGSKFVRVPDMDFTTGRRELNISQLLRRNQVDHRFSDHIRIVEAEESAKYVEPRGVVAKVWDSVSEYCTLLNCKICAHDAFRLV
jgi:amino acid transporter